MTQDGVILAINSGSSSLKVGCYARGSDSESLVLAGAAEGIGREEGLLYLVSATGEKLFEQQHVSETQEQALGHLVGNLRSRLTGAPLAVGHRIVHGGLQLREHQRITPDVLTKLKAAVHLAPLHIPAALKLIHAAEQLYPGLPQFACFDTTFHRNMPTVAKHLPLPGRYFDQGVQHYGFHGLSCESVIRRLGSKIPARLVIAHLGNGSSLTAVRDGVSIDTSMGFSPTGGVPMGTRSGDLDPAVLLYLLRTEGLDPDTLETFVNRDCGLAGLSGGEADMQKLLEKADRRDTLAALAVDVFCVEVRKKLGSYAALLGGLDLLVFTGGIGEHSDPIRQRVAQGLDFLFSETPKSNILVMRADEEAQIALHCRYLLASS